MSQLLYCHLGFFLLLFSISSTNARHIEQFVVGGEEIRIGDVPYQAHFVFEATPGSPDRTCGGVLIAPDTVLTSATCVYGVGIGNVVLGEVDLSNLASSQTVDVIVVDKIIIHPEFIPGVDNANVAVVKLTRNARLREGVIEIAELDSSAATHTNHVADISGWNKGLMLKRGSVTVLNNESCAIRYPGFDGKNLMCAANMNQSHCFGDEGAPLAMEMMGVHQVIGIFSHVRNGECNVGWPAVYTRVNAYYDWISTTSF